MTPAGPRQLAGRAAVEAHALRHAFKAGMLGVEPPLRTARTIRSLERYGPLGGAAGVAALRHGDHPGLVDELGELSFGQLHERSNSLANAWRSEGIAEGASVGILCRNHRGFVDATFACAKLGARALYLNTDFAGPQVRDVCAREEVEALVYDEEFADVIGDVEPARGSFLGWTDAPTGEPTLEALVAAGDPADPPKPSDTSHVVLLTSGTTGTPKGAPRQQPRSLATVGAILSKVPFRGREATYVCPPMFHALGFMQTVLAFGLGSTVVSQRRFNPAAAVESMVARGCTALVVVPVQLARILALGDELAAADLSRVRIVFVAGSQLEPDLATRALDALGPTIYNMYGSTEVAWATIATPEDLRAAPGCAGRPPFGTRVRLLDDEERWIDRAGVTGRIFVGNSAPFDGYTGGGTKQVVDGLMSTGDVGHFDEAGRLFVDGRDDEMIVSGGENVFPREVEELLGSHEAIEEAAALGVPDEDFGQRLRAFVALRPGHELSEREVQDYVKANLARYKVPRDVVFVDELPRNPSGKVLKRELAERA